VTSDHHGFHRTEQLFTLRLSEKSAARSICSTVYDFHGHLSSSPERQPACDVGRWEMQMTVKIVPNDKGNPPGKLADAELHFTEGPLDGLKLIGFSVWERKTGTGRNVTFPARQYSVNGERRSFALLRPITDGTGQDRVRDLVLQAYGEHEAAAAIAT
jgi:hypothetical protein